MPYIALYSNEHRNLNVVKRKKLRQVFNFAPRGKTDPLVRSGPAEVNLVS
jgi:hypothetical protein